MMLVDYFNSGTGTNLLTTLTHTPETEKFYLKLHEKYQEKLPGTFQTYRDVILGTFGDQAYFRLFTSPFKKSNWSIIRSGKLEIWTNTSIKIYKIILKQSQTEFSQNLWHSTELMLAKEGLFHHITHNIKEVAGGGLYLIGDPSPFIILHHFDSDAREYSLSMELPYAEFQSKQLIVQLLSGAKELIEKHFYHVDIKPENFLTSNQLPFYSDLGGAILAPPIENIHLDLLKKLSEIFLRLTPSDHPSWTYLNDVFNHLTILPEDDRIKFLIYANTGTLFEISMTDYTSHTETKLRINEVCKIIYQSNDEGFTKFAYIRLISLLKMQMTYQLPTSILCLLSPSFRTQLREFHHKNGPNPLDNPLTIPFILNSCGLVNPKYHDVIMTMLDVTRQKPFFQYLADISQI